jgi:hypothetical protein
LNNPLAMVDILGDDGCYDANGGTIDIAPELCDAAGGYYLGGEGVVVVDGNVYVQGGWSQMNSDGSSTYVSGPVFAGTFADMFSYLLSNLPPDIVNLLSSAFPHSDHNLTQSSVCTSASCHVSNYKKPPSCDVDNCTPAQKADWCAKATTMANNGLKWTGQKGVGRS